MADSRQLLRPTALLIIALFLSLGCPAQGESSTIPELRAKIEQHLKSEIHSDDAVIAALELQQLAHSEKDLAAEVYALKSLGDTYTWLGAYEQALRAYESATGIYDGSLGLELQGQLYFAMSSLLIEMESYEEGLKLLDSAAAIAQESGDKLMSAILEVNRASVLSITDKSFAAEQALEHASAYFKSIGHEHHYGRARNDIGIIYKERSEYEAALTEFDAVLELAKRTDDTSLTVYALLELGDINRITGNYDAARRFLDQALSLSIKAGDTVWSHFSHSYMAELDQETGNMEGAVKHLEQVLRLERRKFNDQVANRSILLKTNAAVMQRENQITLLQKDKKIQAIELRQTRMLGLIIGMGLVLLSLALWLVHKRYKAQTRISRQLSEDNKKLDQHATTDFLTGLFNRRFILDHVTGKDQDRRASNEHTTLILIDLDHFKQINDQHGHDHGDAVLVQISRCLESKLRDTDMVARWGGEEFLLLLKRTTIHQGTDVANGIRQAIAGSIAEFCGIQHQVTATLGVATYRGATTFTEALRCADEALYRGKVAGRNRVEIATD